MSTIKKKDLKKYKSKAKKTKKKDLEELVDADGSPIGGDKGSDRTPTNDSEIETSPQGTTDAHASTAIQPNRYYYGAGGSAYSHGAHVSNESIEDKLAESKMKKIIEDLTNKGQDRDMVKRYNDSDVNRNNIPDIEELATTYKKPIVAKKAEGLIKTFEMNRLNGEEVGIVINYILTHVDLTAIPQDYKNLLKRNL
jgi:hypothetical protein